MNLGTIKIAYLGQTPLSVLPAESRRPILRFEGKIADSEAVALWRNMIIHEGSHLLHHDSLQRLIASGVSPFIIHYGFKKFIQYIAKNNKFLKTPLGNIVRGFSTIPGLFLKLFMRHIFCGALSKYHEYRADFEIIQRTTDINILESGAHMVEHLDKINNHFVDYLIAQHSAPRNPSKNSSRTLQYVISLKKRKDRLEKYPFLKEFEGPHPAPYRRAAYFEEAAKQLRIKEQK